MHLNVRNIYIGKAVRSGCTTVLNIKNKLNPLFLLHDHPSKWREKIEVCHMRKKGVTSKKKLLRACLSESVVQFLQFDGGRVVGRWRADWIN